MANHKSAIKRHKQSLKRRDHNKIIKVGLRTAIKKVRAAVASGDSAGAKTLMRDAEKVIAKASSKGVLHRANARRRISRLAALVAKSAG